MLAMIQVVVGVSLGSVLVVMTAVCCSGGKGDERDLGESMPSPGVSSDAERAADGALG